MKAEQRERTKELFLAALKNTNGNISKALVQMGDNAPSRAAIYLWRKDDEDFDHAVDEVSEIVLDMAESALLKAIQEGDTTAIIFYLKTKGKKRGYTEKSESEIKITKEIDVNF